MSQGAWLATYGPLKLRVEKADGEGWKYLIRDWTAAEEVQAAEVEGGIDEAKTAAETWAAGCMRTRNWVAPPLPKTVEWQQE